MSKPLLLFALGTTRLTGCSGESREEISLEVTGSAHAAETMWSEAANHVRSEAMKSKHPMLSEFPWRFRALPTSPFIASTMPELETAGTIKVPAVDNGLFANVLQVLDGALVAATTGAKLEIDWVRTAEMSDFTYAKIGTDVWAKLFEKPEASDRAPTSSAQASLPNRLNPLLLAPSRGLYTTAPFFDRHRTAYHRVFSDTFRLLPKVQARIQPFLSRFADIRDAGGTVYGLHCRMSTAAVSNAQSTGLVEPCSAPHILKDILARVGEKDVLFMASDSATDVEIVTKALGMRSIVQGGSVSRALDNELFETHQRSGGSVKTAYAAITDVWTLAAVDVLLHNSESNIVATAMLANPQIQLVPLGQTTLPTADAADLLVSHAHYEDFLNKKLPVITRPWTLLIARGFRVKKDAFHRLIAEVRSEMVRPPTSKDPQPSTIVVQGRARDGSVFPGPNDLTQGVIHPKLICLVLTRVLLKAVTSKRGKLKKNLKFHDEVLSILRATNPKMYSTETIATEIGAEIEENDNDIAGADASPPPSDFEEESESGTASFASADRKDIRRLKLTDLVQPHVNALRDQIRESGSYEKTPFVYHAPADVLEQLLPVDEVLSKEPYPPRSLKTTRYRLNPPAGAEFTHNVAFYAGGFYKMQEHPPGVAADGSFPSTAVTKAIERGESVVFRYTHQWSPGAAAVTDAIATSFRRRSNINAYMSGIGHATAMDAHNDAHCFVIFQLSGRKHWSIWTKEDKMLPMPEVYTDGRMIASARYQYGIDGSAPDVDALGRPDYEFVLKPGDMLYVPRGAIHLTSTARNAIKSTKDKSIPPSFHFTVALPMDHQSITWGLGLAKGPGVEQHPYLMQEMRKSAEQLIAREMDLRRSLKPMGNASSMDEDMRAMLHRLVDEMIDSTDYMRLIKQRFQEWDTIALKRTPLDPNV